MSRASVGAWLIVVGLLLSVVAGIGLAGGFAKAPPRPATVGVGEWIHLTRWDLRFDGCARQLASEGDRVRLQLTAVNRWHQTQADYNRQAWRIEVPGGEVFGGNDGQWPSFLDAERPSGSFDPDIERPVAVELRLTRPAWRDDAPVRVVLATEAPQDGLVLEGAWYGDEFAAALELACPVAEAGS